MTRREFVKAANFTPNALVPQAWPGWTRKIKGITIHHWGDRGQKHDGIVAFFSTVAPTSAHYVVSGGRITQMVSDQDAAWHAGSAEGNATTIGIECRPEATDADYATVAELVRELRAKHGDLPLYPHRHWYGTACPGVWDLNRLDRLARGGTTTGAQNMGAYTGVYLDEIRAAMNEAKGSYLNLDMAYGYQCVDVADWAAWRLTGLPWQQSIGADNAIDLPNVAPAAYWTWEVNGPSNTPPEGALVIFGGTPSNPYGHVAWAGYSDQSTVWVLEQNTYGTADTPCQVNQYDYVGNRIGPVLGWLRLKESAMRLTGSRAVKPAPAAASVPARKAAPARKTWYQQLKPKSSYPMYRVGPHGGYVRASGSVGSKAVKLLPAGSGVTVVKCISSQAVNGSNKWYELYAANATNTGTLGWIHHSALVKANPNDPRLK